LKIFLKCIDWFIESLYAEFIDWMKFLLLGTGGFLLAVFMWQSEGLLGKTVVIITAIVKTLTQLIPPILRSAAPFKAL
jgi:hypothetical protein